jgi:UDP-glucose 4-epimerase
MNILFTGASSFTGVWFVEELAKAGHKVATIFRQPINSYQGMRKERVEKAVALSLAAHFGIIFGDENFLAICSSNHWHLFCHHAADVENYKSPHFDVARAFANNTRALPDVLAALKDAGCRHLLLTGTVFEQNEGALHSTPALSPYGLSKGLTAEAFRFYAAQLGLALGKFVIPNPFGPYEEARFTTHLAESWLQGRPASVHTPLYVRDNVPVSLLAKAYAQFAADKDSWNSSMNSFFVRRPSGYISTQGDFAERCAREMRARFGLACEMIVHAQAEFREPVSRINSEPLNARDLGWHESAFWDAFAHFYQKRLCDA